MSDKADNNCPLCKQDNQCAVAAGRPPETCWCQGAVIAEAALRALPDEERGVRCICPECAKERYPDIDIFKE